MHRFTLICWSLVVFLHTTDPSWAESLPRVLILGDEVSKQPARSVAAELKGRAVVVWKHPGDTSSALAQLDKVLGDTKWDVIHFNFGLADLHYKDPRTQTTRVMSKHAGGVRVTSPEQYRENLQQLVKRLKATRSKLVWASTTPIPSSKFDHFYDPGSEIEYNDIAAKVMGEHGITVNDLHAEVLEQTKDKKSRDPFSHHRIVPLHRPMVRHIVGQLELPEGH